MLKIVFPICCGIDVHKRFVVATIASTNINNVTSYATSTFTTFNKDLYKLKAWLLDHNCKHVCMESTGKYWIPVFNILEDSCDITLANPKYVKAISGKKTDKKDSLWIADLHKHGLVPGSFIPPADIRNLRDLVRYRTKLVSNRSSEKNRVQNSLTVSNIAISNVVSDTFGKSSSDIIQYLIQCNESDSTQSFSPEHCKSLLRKTLKKKGDDVVDSITGYNLSNEQASKLNIAYKHYNYINDCIKSAEEVIFNLAKSYESQIQLILSVPGIQKLSAVGIISEIGADMSVFPSSKHLCSWAGLTPQNNESAGKKKSSRISRAGVYLKPLLVQCALCAIRSKDNTYFKTKYDTIKKRRGHKKAIIAIARRMLTCIYHILTKNESFNPVDINYSDMSKELFEKNKQKYVSNAIVLLQAQGYIISKTIASSPPI